MFGRKNLSIYGRIIYYNTLYVTYHAQQDDESADDLGVEPVLRLYVLPLLQDGVVDEETLLGLLVLAVLDVALDPLLKLRPGSLLRGGGEVGEGEGGGGEEGEGGGGEEGRECVKLPHKLHMIHCQRTNRTGKSCYTKHRRNAEETAQVCVCVCVYVCSPRQLRSQACPSRTAGRTDASSKTPGTAQLQGGGRGEGRGGRGEGGGGRGEGG